MTSYDSIHHKLRAERGPARQYTCPNCGFNARQWAYDHTDPDEIRDSRGRTYSLDLGKYMPMCTPCHYKFDAPYSSDPRRKRALEMFPRPSERHIEYAKKKGIWPPPPRPPYIPRQPGGAPSNLDDNG